MSVDPTAGCGPKTDVGSGPENDSELADNGGLGDGSGFIGLVDTVNGSAGAGVGSDIDARGLAADESAVTGGALGVWSVAGVSDIGMLRGSAGKSGVAIGVGGSGGVTSLSTGAAGVVVSVSGSSLGVDVGCMSMFLVSPTRWCSPWS